jgi:hypothetical protein
MGLDAEINKKNLKWLCAINGIGTVTELSRRIKKSRKSIYGSLEKPSTFPVVYRRIQKALPLRTVNCK